MSLRTKTFRLLFARRDSNAGDAAATAPSKPRRIASRAFRWTMYAAIAWFGGQLLLKSWRLMQPSPRVPASAVSDTTDNLPTGAAWLDGAWTAGDSSLAVRYATLSEKELEERWNCVGCVKALRGRTGAGESYNSSATSELERRLVGWVSQLPGTTETLEGDAVVKSGTLHGVRFRVVLSKESPARLRLAQAAWSVGPKRWGVIQIAHADRGAKGSAARSRRAAALFPSPLGTPLARRWSADGRLTAEVFALSSPIDNVISSWRANGGRVRESNRTGDMDVLTLERPQGKPLLALVWKQPSVSYLILLDLTIP